MIPTVPGQTGTESGIESAVTSGDTHNKQSILLKFRTTVVFELMVYTGKNRGQNRPFEPAVQIDKSMQIGLFVFPTGLVPDAAK
jgi:hypothetical protein